MRRLLGVAAFLLAAPILAAQEESRISQLARLLEAEDRREYLPEVFRAGLASRDPVVRRQAALGAGRIQDPRATGSLLALLADPDTAIHAAAMFALGLLADTSAASAIIARLVDPAPLADGAVAEAPSTLGKLRTPEARAFFGAVLEGDASGVGARRRWLMLPGLLVEGWRFGRAAPVSEAVPHLRDASDAVRWRAAYLLGRTRAAVGSRALLARAADPHPWVRQFVARGLTRLATDSADVPRDSAVAVLRRALRDPDPGVRVNALQSLATDADSAHGADVLPLLRDRIPNVRLQAVATLGAIGGSAARRALDRLSQARGEPLVIRREALLGLLRRDTALVRSRIAGLAASRDRGARLLAIELATTARAPDATPFLPLLEDPDVDVRTTAFTALGALDSALAADLDARAARMLEDPDRRVRGAALTIWARRSPSAEQVAALVATWTRELARGREAVTAPLLAALRRAWADSGASREAVRREFLETTRPPTDYLLRRAAGTWPELAERWGPVFPAETTLTPADYREIAAGLLLGPAVPRPKVRLETAGRGVVVLELLADQAPLTVRNFLHLVDRGFFDGGEWHRVIPNFVVQDGAGRPEDLTRVAPIRDEFNPVRYDQPVLGMALSGPDTGTSQWFVNLSPQPHLDGGYTVFGRVMSGWQALEGILQGDRITGVRREVP